MRSGQSVTTKNLNPGEGPTGEECEEGGTEFTSASGTSVVCNGEEGTVGPAGPAGPTCPGGLCVAPEGSTQVGVWSFRAKEQAAEFVTISFPLQLPSSPTFHYVKWAEQGTPSAPPGCPSPFPEEPEALPGNFCVYEGEEVSDGELVNAGVPTLATGSLDNGTGRVLKFTLTNPANEARGTGSWAVTR